jgi:hypothetical protein
MGRKRDWAPKVAGPDGWSEWTQPKRNGYRLACCDCGLVHEMQFRLVPAANGHGIQFRCRRDKRTTAALRREDRRRQARAAHRGE